MKKTYYATIALIFNFLLAHAGGFQVNLQSTRSAGMGHTGTGLRLGASSGFFNPGALAFSNAEVHLGINLIRSRITYREWDPGIYTAQTTSGIGTPFFGHAAFKFNPDSKFVFGISIYTPFGSGVSYEDDWKGQFLLREMSLRAIFYQATVAYQLNDKLGIGAAYVFATGDFALRRGVPIQDASGNYGEANLSGSGIGHGFNLGIFYQLSDQVSLGFSYRSGVRVDLNEGLARFDVPPALNENFPETGFTSSLRLPKVINWGVGIQATEKTLLSFDVNYVGWSSYDTLAFDFVENTEQLNDVKSPRRYKDVVILRAGIEHEFSSKLTARGGLFWDFSPVQDGYMTPETPDMDKLGVTAGLTYNFSDKMSVDLSFMYIHGPQRTDRNFETDFAGRWNARAFIPGFAFCYKF
jgi:long-chain fatty acid transport protein